MKTVNLTSGQIETMKFLLAIEIKNILRPVSGKEKDLTPSAMTALKEAREIYHALEV